jgi:type IV secretion system protein TrbB
MLLIDHADSSMAISNIREDRLTAMLATALGETAGKLLLDPGIIELMLNPDGRLWIDRLGEGRSFTGQNMTPADAERVIFIVASSIGSVCNKESPLLSAELPVTGARFQGILPPVSPRPIFSIRKKAIKVFTLADYICRGTMSCEQAELIESAVATRRNILIAGGTGSGKTTLANAILARIAVTKDRIVIIEDTQELQCQADDFVTLRTKDGTCSMRDLLRATMRLRPDRIVIGEVRGPEALDLLKAWNTGHPGGCATVHADSAAKAITRLEQLVQEAGVQNARALIAEAVNLIIYIEKTATGRQVKEILGVNGLSDSRYSLERLPNA